MTRAKTCRICREKFIPTRGIQPVCEKFACNVTFATAAAEKAVKARKAAERKKLAGRREGTKRKSDLMKEAQAAFNAFIRARDLAAGHPCICCGNPFEPQRPGGSVDAGHYLSVGSAYHLRFDERNCHAQRKSCNRPGGTSRAAFRAGMIERIGFEAVESLEADQTERRYRADDLREIRGLYREKLRRLRRVTN